jgi:fermentation-respiration switch protein FrsA (DUF1100 family)
LNFRIRPRRHALVIAIALLLLAGVGLWTVGYALSRPARAVLGAPPPDLGAKTVRITRAGAPPVFGWLAPGIAGTGAVLLLHPLRGNRGVMVTRARFLHRAGYTVLLVDLPAHGESAGDRITFGARESAAARAALAYLRRVTPGERIGALGVSLGGASLLLGVGEPVANSAAAVVLEAVYPTIGEAVANRLRIRLGALGPPLTRLFTSQLRAQVGVGAEELRPIDRVRRVRVPLLVIAGEADQHTTLAESERLFAAAPGPKSLWVVPRAPHGDLYASAPAEYERHILAFFGHYLRRAS